ncbi:MAG: protein-L-isoaspartate O-methyltransferase [Rhizobacter sp.]|nr:protein-L-isoaspartate O-methyltransferase [Rhizobacter sp.]
MTQADRKPPKFPLQLDRVSRQPDAAPRPVIRGVKPPATAHLEAARLMRPNGAGPDYRNVRQRMVDRLRAYGVLDDAVLTAMSRVPRHSFVDTGLATQAYEDTSLPIGLEQTISKPSVVSRMLELLRGGVNARAMNSLGCTLEIGTGCGYQAAVLSLLSRQVYSLERLKPLHDKARELLAPIRPPNLRLVYGDGRLGHAPNAPYDSIVAAAGGQEMPDAWLSQLAVGGRLVAPMLDARRGGQVLVVVDRTESGYTRSLHESVHFVPLKSGLD